MVQQLKQQEDLQVNSITPLDTIAVFYFLPPQKKQQFAAAIPDAHPDNLPHFCKVGDSIVQK